MANVTVLGPGGRRKTLRASPGVLLGDFMAEACAAFGANAAASQLLFRGKAVDLSVPFRLSGIPNNARLELVSRNGGAQSAQGGAIAVALQLEDGRRLLSKALSTMPFWKILEKVEKEHGVALTSQSDAQGNLVIPAVSYLQRQVNDVDGLCSTSPVSLGVSSGSILLRLTLRPSSIPLSNIQKMVAARMATQGGVQRSASASEVATRVAKTESASPVRSQTSEPRVSEAQAAAPSQPSPATPFHRTDMQTSGMGVHDTATKSGPREANSASTSLSAIESRPEYGSAVPMDEGLDSAPASSEQHDSQAAPSVAEALPDAIDFAAEHERALREAFPETDVAQSSSSSSSRHGANPPLLQDSEPVASCKGDAVPAEVVSKGVERQLRLYRATEGSSERIELPEEYFEVTADDLRRVLATAERKRREVEEQGFQTRAVRERREQQKRARYRRCVIRIRLPDRSLLEGHFTPLECCSALYEFVRNALRDPSRDFYLFQAPPVQRIPNANDHTLWDAKLVPAAVVILGGYEANTTVNGLIKSDLVEDMLDLPASMDIVGETVAEKAASATSSAAAPRYDHDPSAVNRPSQPVEPRSSASKKPKWLKM